MQILLKQTQLFILIKQRRNFRVILIKTSIRDFLDLGFGHLWMQLVLKLLKYPKFAAFLRTILYENSSTGKLSDFWNAAVHL